MRLQVTTWRSAEECGETVVLDAERTMLVIHTSDDSGEQNVASAPQMVTLLLERSGRGLAGAFFGCRK